MWERVSEWVCVCVHMECRCPQRPDIRFPPRVKSCEPREVGIGSELGSFERAVHAFKYWAPPSFLFIVIKILVHLLKYKGILPWMVCPEAQAFGCLAVSLVLLMLVSLVQGENCRYSSLSLSAFHVDLTRFGVFWDETLSWGTVQLTLAYGYVWGPVALVINRCSALPTVGRTIPTQFSWAVQKVSWGWRDGEAHSQKHKKTSSTRASQ